MTVFKAKYILVYLNDNMYTVFFQTAFWCLAHHESMTEGTPNQKYLGDTE